MTNEEYAQIHAINYSALKVGRTSLPRMHAVVTGTAAKSESDSLNLGTLLHEAMQNGLAWQDRYAVRPEGIDRRTKDGKAAYAAWLQSLPADAQIVEDGSQIQLVEQMRQAILDHRVGRLLATAAGQSELMLVHGDRKCRVDRLTDAFIIDWKTCTDSTPTGFAKACARYGYAQQAAWYVEMVRLVTGKTLPFVFVAVESSEPHCVGVYQLAADQIEAATRLNERIVADYRKFVEAGARMHHTSDDKIEELVLPEWAVTDKAQIPGGFDLAAESPF